MIRCHSCDHVSLSKTLSQEQTHSRDCPWWLEAAAHAAKHWGWPLQGSQREANSPWHTATAQFQPLCSSPWSCSQRIKLKNVEEASTINGSWSSAVLPSASLLSSSFSPPPSNPATHTGIPRKSSACLYTSLTPTNKEARREKLQNLIWLVETNSHYGDLREEGFKFAYHEVFKINLCTFYFNAALNSSGKLSLRGFPCQVIEL